MLRSLRSSVRRAPQVASAAAAARAGVSPPRASSSARYSPRLVTGVPMSATAMTMARAIHTGRKGCTFHYQKSMPRLPIPELDKSLDSYLNIASCILTDAELEQTKKAVADFKVNDGPRLHAALVARDKAHPDTSYINEWWFDMYLESRAPLALNSNPFLKLADDARPGMDEQVHRAAALVHSSARFYYALRSETLEPDIFHVGTRAQQPWFKTLVNFVPQMVSYYAAYLAGSYPLDMSQYPRLFGSTRVPLKGKDRLDTTQNAKHIAVLREGRFYSIRILEDDAITPRAPQAIENELRAAVAAADAASAASKPAPIAALSGIERDRWADLRERLIAESETNRASFAELDSALFVLCLDSGSFGPRSVDGEMTKEAATESFPALLHGNGLNRWFDKSFSLILSKEAIVGVNFEHSWGDGVSVLRYVNEIHDDVAPFDSDAAAGDVSQVKELEFETPSKKLAADVSSARDDFVTMCDRLRIGTVIHSGFGKNFFKAQRIAPDGCVQQAIQLAYAAANNGQTVATYESASTAGFKKGRTEVIRPATPESQAFVRHALQAVADNSLDDGECALLLRIAADTHKDQSIACAMGKGFDRHLFALRQLAAEEASPGDAASMPPLFQDAAYARMNHNILSTSTIFSPAIVGGGFGPVVDDGYGIGYATGDDMIGFQVSSYASDEELSIFCKHLEEALLTIERILADEKAKPSNA